MDNGQTMTNTEFDFSLGGKTYKVKKASLKQVMQFQRKVAEITAGKDPARDLMMVAYAIYLILNAIDASITEDYVLENAAGDIDIMETFITLGFMSQQKVQTLSKIADSLAAKNPSTGEESSAS